jgi:2,3-bisphosphoglycerate-dependent phosphoglycerate mutase
VIDSSFAFDIMFRRRSLKARPPPAEKNDNINNPGNDRKYNDLLPEQIPQSESLEDCLMRTEPLWQFIKRDLMKGENVMVVAHANSLRGLAKIIDNIGDEEIQDVSFPKGIPLIYRFSSNMDIVKPSETDLTPIHTSGIFLEKPKLLEVAIAKVKKEDSILGSDVSGRLPGVAKRMSTVEESLLQLRKEKEEWSKSSESVSDEDESSLEDEEEKNDERFETKSASANKEGIQVTFNTNAVNNPKDPVVVLIRHGRTPHNKLSLFTGWEDPPLAEEGVEDAEWAGRLLKKHGFEFDVVYTSWLYRAIQTAWYVLYEMDQLWVPLMKSWRLNERHYGDLTGKSKKMIGNIYGEDQLKKWRKGYKQRPPQVSSYSFNYPGNDKRRIKYVKDIRVSFTETICRSIEDRKFSLHRKFPKGESLKDTMDRSIPFYTERIVPEAIAKGKRVLITSHENAIRGILMHLCEIPEECMTDLNLPNGVPLVYNVRRKCISLLDDGTGDDPLEKYNFGSAAQYLFRPCEIDEDEDWYVGSLNE